MPRPVSGSRSVGSKRAPTVPVAKIAGEHGHNRTPLRDDLWECALGQKSPSPNPCSGRADNCADKQRRQDQSPSPKLTHWISIPAPHLIQQNHPLRPSQIRNAPHGSREIAALLGVPPFGLRPTPPPTMPFQNP